MLMCFKVNKIFNLLLWPNIICTDEYFFHMVASFLMQMQSKILFNNRVGVRDGVESNINISVWHSL